MTTQVPQNRWEQFAAPGFCKYCGHAAKVRPEPFGGEDACQNCWEDICYGSDD